ncbi:uncharacterized protein LOC141626478 [Silene latifolia]|uniref:uncharacterized protein LOC141626478 n=1 Tax=Silene latifolia TaxID=37657 RepID=UPI003D772046
MARNKRTSSPTSTSKFPKNNISSTNNKNSPKNSTITANITNLSEPVSHDIEAESSSMAEIRAFNLNKELVSINEDQPTDDAEWTVVSNRGKQKSATSGKAPPLKIDIADVTPEVEFWSNAISCYVLGANPPKLVLGGFIRRIWKKLSIVSTMFQPNGFCLIRFKTKDDKHAALHSGPLFFDNKPFVVKEWTPGMKLTKEKPDSIPVWIHLYDLDLKYWGLALPKIVSLVGKPICCDQATKNREFLGYARYLVEVKVGEHLPDSIEFIDENGLCQQQLVHFEWKPILCTVCKGVGHETGLCKKKTVVPKPKKTQQVWKPKAPAPPKEKIPEQVAAKQPDKGSKTDVALPLLQPNMVATPMPYQGSVLNSLTPARFINRFSKKGEECSAGPSFVDVISYSIRKNIMSSMGKGLTNINTNGLYGLVETKVKTININKVQAGLGYNWQFINNNDLKESGRIWLLWDPAIFKVDVLLKDVQVIHATVEHLLTGFSWVCSLVYGCNKDSERVGLWQSILHCNSLVNSPWLLMGDFNNVLLAGERLGSDVSLAEVKAFQDCVDRCELYDFVTRGAYFTWNNKQEENTRVLSRINRVLANDQWLTNGPSSIASFLPECLFDHSPCIIKLWEKIKGCKIFQVVKKLKLLKFPLRQLNKEGFGDILNTAKVAQMLLDDIQRQLHQDPTNVGLQYKERAAAQTFKDLVEARNLFLNQKAKIHWMKCNDENSHYFHSSIKARRAQNKILSIKDHYGNQCTDNKSIEDAFLAYYKDLLGSSKHVVRVNLGVRVTGDEVHEAMFSIPIDKAPGPDGYTSGFFKDSFGIVNATVVTLIPKKQVPETVMDYRPIACCNVFFKCISKIICARLSKVLPTIVSSNQSAFVQGREIVDNVLICQDLMRLYNRKICSPRVMIKIDLKKAYDSIEWDFVEDLLVALKFPTQMVNWIMQCVSSPSYTLSLNGSHFGFFKGRIGLRQGDPLSPLLFTLCLEYFTRILAVVTLRHDFHFHPMCRALGLCHLAFADDLLLFCRGDASSVKVLMRALHTFSIASGLTVNKSKSDIFMNGLTDTDKAYILQLSGFKKEYQLYLGRAIAGLKNKGDLVCTIAISGIFPVLANILVDCQQKGQSLVKEKLKRGFNVQQWVQGSFSAQQTYDSLAGTSESVPWEPFVWNRICLPKVNFIIWLFAKDRLLTKHRLLKFGVISDGLCCICANAQETQSHLFFDCPFSKECLQLVLQWLGISWHFHMDTIMSWQCRSLLKKQIIMASFAGLIYLIWSCGNSAKHNGSIIRPKLVLQRVQSMVKYRMQGIQSEISILRCCDWLASRCLCTT